MINTLDFACFRLNNGTPEILLRMRDNIDEPAYGEYALVGGWVWEAPLHDGAMFDSSLEEAQARIIEMKVGIKPSYVSQIQTLGNNWRDARGWSMTVIHLCFFNSADCHALSEKNGMKWVPVASIIDGEQVGQQWVSNTEEGITLCFDHNLLATLAYQAMQHRLTYSSLAFYILPDTFSVPDVIEAFAAFGVRITKQTIANRWVKSGLITDTGEKGISRRGGQKPTLYRLAEQELSFFDVSLGRTSQ